MNDYNDFRLIDEDKLNKLACEYNNKLNEVKIYNFEENFEEKFKNLQNCLSGCLHYVNNMILSSKNKEILNELSLIKDNLLRFEENLNVLYEKDGSKDEDNFDKSFSNNKQGFFDCLFGFLENLFDFENFEVNGKIKASLNSMIKEVIEILKKINNLDVNVLKIFSLFFRKK